MRTGWPHQALTGYSSGSFERRKRVAALLALCRQEVPEVCIRLTELPLAQLIQGLDADLFDAGLKGRGRVRF